MRPVLPKVSSATFDKALFNVVLNLNAIQVESSRISSVLKEFSDYILDLSSIKNIVSTESKKHKLIILKENADTTALKQFKIVPHKLCLDYDYFSADEVLQSFLPQGMEITTAFETVGHVSHMNLREEHMPFKNIIGQVILDKNPKIKTVVTKIGEIENAFRVFDMEVIAGVPDFMVKVRESDCNFEFDYSKVYWNSRLQTEHSRLVSLLKPGQRVCDVFAGVGPFSVPAAKKKCIVYANDLNPDSVKFLEMNLKNNKTKAKLHNMDGRDFIRHNFDKLNSFCDHYIMNLPAIAYTFLDAFIGILDGKNETYKMPLIHCYLFAKEQDPVQMVEQVLNAKIETSNLHFVRKVSPKKTMYCLSFVLPESVLRRSKKLKLQE